MRWDTNELDDALRDGQRYEIQILCKSVAIAKSFRNALYHRRRHHTPCACTIVLRKTSVFVVPNVARQGIIKAEILT